MAIPIGLPGVFIIYQGNPCSSPGWLLFLLLRANGAQDSSRLYAHWSPVLGNQGWEGGREGGREPK